MKKFTKIALIVALCCIGAGLLLAIPALIALEPEDISIDISDLNNTNTVEKTMQISGEVRSIEINDIHYNISILPATDGQCRVDYTDSDLYTHSITCADGVLSIELEDVGSFEDHFFSIQGYEYVTVYLSDPALESVEIETVSGDIEVAADISLLEAGLSSTSGNLFCDALIQNSLRATSTSGNVEIDSPSRCEVDVSATSGDVILENLCPIRLNAETASGDIELDNVMVNGNMELSTASGSIELQDVDAFGAALATASGDVTGYILSPKHFDVSTVSGQIEIQDTYDAEDVWEISTTSGDIILKIAQ